VAIRFLRPEAKSQELAQVETRLIPWVNTCCPPEFGEAFGG